MYWFSIINDEIFGNKLAPVALCVRRLRGMWGFFEDEENYLAVNETFPSKNLFLNVLAHEMVHAYQYQQGLAVNHGKTFWEWRKKFKSNGLTLAIQYHDHSKRT